MLASPKSRKKLEQRQNRTSPSPSPLKRASATPNARNVQRNLDYDQMDGVLDEGDDDEDEEVLQLRLQALETKLKLKKMQKKKARATVAEQSSENENESTTIARSASVLASRREPPKREHILARSKSSGDVQVPLSPERQRTITKEPRSPGRILLGIDKGLSARNISLKRPPAPRPTSMIEEDSFGGELRSAGIRRAQSVSKSAGRATPKSFNERMAESRVKDKEEQERRERSARLKMQRNTGFGIQQHELDAFEEAAAKRDRDAPEQPILREQRKFSREEVLRAISKSSVSSIQRTNTLTSTRGTQRITSNSSVASSEAFSRPKSAASVQQAAPQGRVSRQEDVSLSDDSSRPSTPSGDPKLFEPFSKTNLSRRILPHTFLTRTLEEKTPLLIPDLLRDVKAPDFCLPDSIVENDYVVFGIIGSKSEPLSHKDNNRTRQTMAKSDKTSVAEAAESVANVNGKYMVFRLTDLEMEVDLYLFTTAFVRFRKMTPGTVIAILNPSIMRPQPSQIDTGRWSLTLNSSEDTVLEIGTSKDMSWCSAIKKDGRQCNAWVDGRKTSFCIFHVDLNVERARRGRMETQGMSAPFAPGGKGAGRHGYFGAGKRGKKGEEGDGLLKEGRQYDRTIQSAYFITPSLMKSSSTAALFDTDVDSARGSTNRQERDRQVLAAREKEREIAGQIAKMGGGAGAEYLRTRHSKPESSAAGRESQASNTTSSSTTEPRDAASLGLKSNTARDVLLSPLKRKLSTASGGPKKKTRFITAKGIRVAGRDSLPRAAGDSDDDGLDIV